MTSNKSKHGESIRGLTLPRDIVVWIIVALVFCGSMALVVRHRGDTPAGYKNDEQGYHVLATSMLKDHSYGSFTYWGPGYPVLVAGVYAIAGHRPVAVYATQSILFVLTLLLIYNIAWSIFFRKSYAVMCMGLAALWPFYYQNLTGLLPEIWTGFLSAVAMWHLIKLRDQFKATDAVICGAMLGFVCLIKPVMLLFVPVAAILVATRQQKWQQKLVAALVILVSSGMLVVPWTVRNYCVTKAFVPVTTGGGFNFWLGNWPEYYQQKWTWRDFPTEIDRQIRTKTEVEQDKILMRTGVGYIKENPIRAARIFGLKFSEMWLGGIGRNPKLGKTIFHVGTFGIPFQVALYIPLLLLAILGYSSLDRLARLRAYPLVALLLCWTLVYVITTVAPHRYALPVIAYEMVFAAAGIHRILDIMAPKCRRQTNIR